MIIQSLTISHNTDKEETPYGKQYIKKRKIF